MVDPDLDALYTQCLAGDLETCFYHCYSCHPEIYFSKGWEVKLPFISVAEYSSTDVELLVDMW
jgi:hypothetical protein